MANLRSRNNLGQYTKNLDVLITKELQKKANEIGINIRPIIRDKLEAELKYNIYSTYAPVSNTGRSVEEYNNTHKHQKKKSYHHTGILISSIKGSIDGNVVKAGPDENVKYPDGTSATQVYNWLKYGTAPKAKTKSYSYTTKDGQENWASYNPQPKHDFEKMTLLSMDNIIKDVIKNYSK